MGADVTFTSIAELRAYIDEKLVPNTTNKIRAQEHNNIENGILDLMGFSIVNIETATGPDTAQTGTVQYNDDGTIWLVDREGSAIVLSSSPLVAYKVWVGYLSMGVGSTDIIATVFENTLGGTIAWARVDEGVYTATLEGAFPIGNTYIPTNSLYLRTVSGGAGMFTMQRNSDDDIAVQVINDVNQTTDINAFPFNTKIPVEIRVYQ